MRGIKSNKVEKDGKMRTSDSVDPNYDGGASHKYWEDGKLLNGQWWPLQLCTIRDGAHGSTQGGISGKAGEGAYSCIISHGLALDGRPYPNEDHGDVVHYYGTDNDPLEYSKDEDGNPKPSHGTQLLLDSYKNQRPVRFIRSHNLESTWAPKEGFRNDGLYHVVNYRRMDPEFDPRQRHRFKLQRKAGQDPIRGGDGPEARPTAQEIEEFKKHKRFSTGRD